VIPPPWGELMRLSRLLRRDWTKIVIGFDVLEGWWMNPLVTPPAGGKGVWWGKGRIGVEE